MKFIFRTMLSISLIALAGFAVVSVIIIQDLEGRMARLENTTTARLNTVSAQLAAQNVAFSDLADQLNTTREQLSLETIGLRDAIAEQAKDLKAETANLRSTTKTLESSLSKETEARISSSINLSSQISSIDVDGQEIALDIEPLLASVVLVACEISPDNFSQGSGTIIDAFGTIITNAHVVDPNKDIGTFESRLCIIASTVSESEPPVYKYTAEIQSVEHDDDVSQLKVSGGVNGHIVPSAFEYLEYPTCTTDKPRINDSVFTVGYPVIGQSTFTITDGIISGFIDGHMKTSAKIDQGNSGGAVVNTAGDFIGIPTYGVVGELDSLGYVIDLQKRVCNG